VRIRFWGTRGSIPTPGPSTVRYGGNTACIEVRDATGTLLVLDAGTGLRELGLHLLRDGRNGALEVEVLLSHLHWDHIQGLPFFRPVADARNTIRLHGPHQSRPIEEILGVGMDEAFFPVNLDTLPAHFEFHDLQPGATTRIGPYGVRSSAPLFHPAPALAYRVEADGVSLVYATDTEDPLSGKPNPVVDLARGAHTLLHDAQYLPEDYKQGWGHSTVPSAIDVAVAAGVRRLVLTHHDPDRSDEALDRIGDEARRAARSRNPDLEVIVAREGLELPVA